MTKLKEALPFMKMIGEREVRIAELELQLFEQEHTLHQVEQDRQLLARTLVKTAEFDEWLMDQDLSCAHQRKPSDDVKRVQVEGATDLTLAVAYAGRAQS